MPDRALLKLSAWVFFAGTIAAWGLALALDTPPLVTASDITWALSFLAFPVVGLLLAIRRPRNPIGWLFVVGPGLIGVGVALMESGREQSGSSVFGAGVLLLLASLLVFPDGRYPSRWWGWAHGAVLAGVLFEPSISPGTDGGVSVGAAFLLTVGSLVYRVVRDQGEARRQIALPVLVGVLGFIGVTATSWLVDSQWADVLWFSVLTVGIPTAIAVSILRYRLFDLDRLVSRTVSYALVAIVVATVYAVPVLIVPRFIGGSSDLVVAGGTLAAAAAFSPARRRIQRLVDRRFNRARYDSEREIESFANRLRSALDLGEISTDLVRVVDSTVAPQRVGLWIRAAD